MNLIPNKGKNPDFSLINKSKKLRTSDEFISSPIFKTILDRNLKPKEKPNSKQIALNENPTKISQNITKNLRDERSLSSSKQSKTYKHSKSFDNELENLHFQSDKFRGTNQKPNLSISLKNNNLIQRPAQKNPYLNNFFLDTTKLSKNLKKNDNNNSVKNINLNNSDYKIFPFSDIRTNNNSNKEFRVKKNNKVFERSVDGDRSKDSNSSKKSFKSFFLDQKEDNNKNSSANEMLLKNLLGSSEKTEDFQKKKKNNNNHKIQNNVINLVDSSENININISTENNENSMKAVENRKLITNFLFNVIKDFEKIVNEGPTNSMDLENDNLKDFCLEKTIDYYKKIHRFFNETQLNLLKFNKDLDSSNKNIVFTVLTFFSTFNTTRIKNLEIIHDFYEKNLQENNQTIENKKQEISNLQKDYDFLKNENTNFKKEIDKINKEKNELIENSNNFKEKMDFELQQLKENNKQLISEINELNTDKLNFLEKMELQKKQLAKISADRKKEHNSHNSVDNLKLEHLSKQLSESLEENKQLYAENDSLKIVIKTQTEKNEKVMKLLYAIKRQGIDIEKMYIEEVMNQTPVNVQNIESKYSVEKVEEMPEEEESSEIHSKRTIKKIVLLKN